MNLWNKQTKKNRKGEGGGARVAATGWCLFKHSHRIGNESLYLRESSSCNVQEPIGEWAAQAATPGAGASLKTMASVVIDLLCMSQSCGASKCSTKGSGTPLSTREASTWNICYVSPLLLPKCIFIFIYLFLIKTNQLTCKITVLMFRALEKLCSVQMVSKACTGENRRQRRQTNKLANQKTFSLSIRRDIIPFLIKALTHLFFCFFWWRLRP